MAQAVTLRSSSQFEPLLFAIVFCAIGCVVLGILFAPWWGLGGVAFAMAASMLITLWPIQFYEVRRIFRATPTALEPQRAAKKPEAGIEL